MAGASNLQNRKSASNFQPMLAGTPQAYFTLKELGLNVVTATLFANTAQVNAVAHSLGVTPSAWVATQLESVAATRLFNLNISEASAPNNSVVGVFVTGYSIADKTSVPYRFTFFPPAT